MPIDLLHQDVDAQINALVTKVIGAAIEVHRILGPGLSEGVYENALAIELNRRDIKFERQARLPVTYKGVQVGEGIVDLLIERTLVVELKAVSELLPVHDAQVMTYLKLLNLELGLLLNFNVALMKGGVRRIVLPAKLRTSVGPRA